MFYTSNLRSIESCQYEIRPKMALLLVCARGVHEASELSHLSRSNVRTVLGGSDGWPKLTYHSILVSTKSRNTYVYISVSVDTTAASDHCIDKRFTYLTYQVLSAHTKSCSTRACLSAYMLNVMYIEHHRPKFKSLSAWWCSTSDDQAFETAKIKLCEYFM